MAYGTKMISRAVRTQTTFSAPLRRQWRGASLTPSILRFQSSLKIDKAALVDQIQSTALMAGATDDGGLHRLALDDNDVIIRNWFKDEVEALGMEYTVDEVGSQWAIMKGENNSIAPIGIGSHMDSVPCGGRYDGPLGVLTALESVKAMKKAGYKNYAPIAVINWTGEEGSRFAPACLASGVWCGAMTTDAAYQCFDTETPSITLDKALTETGFKGSTPADHKKNPLSAHFELHIEQGVRIETAGKDIGIVVGNQANHWFRVKLVGFSRHTDTTPMDKRRDALLGAAQMIQAVNELSIKNKGFGTVTIFNSHPKSGCNIPGNVEFLFSIQNEQLSNLKVQEKEILQAMSEIADKNKLEMSMTQVLDIDPFDYNATIADCFRDAAHDEGWSTIDIVSHTVHDSSWTNNVCPTAMVMCRSKDGISHNPSEYSTPEDCYKGAQTLLGAVVKYDGMLRSGSA